MAVCERIDFSQSYPYRLYSLFYVATLASCCPTFLDGWWRDNESRLYFMGKSSWIKCGNTDSYYRRSLRLLSNFIMLKTKGYSIHLLCLSFLLHIFFSRITFKYLQQFFKNFGKARHGLKIENINITSDFIF